MKRAWICSLAVAALRGRPGWGENRRWGKNRSEQGGHIGPPLQVKIALLGGLALFAALAPPPAAAQPAPIGPVFQVNTSTESDQLLPVVASNGGGRFVVVWESNATGNEFDYDLFAQVFDASGARIGTEFRVAQTTAGSQDEPAVAMDEDGGFVVVWSHISPEPDELSQIFGRRFDASGAPLGDEFAVSEAAGSLYSPAIALDGKGRFVVAWNQLYEIYARRFDAAGRPLGAPFLVSTEIQGPALSPAVAVSPAGNFSVIYQSYGYVPERDSALLARRFTAKGKPVGDPVVLDVPGQFQPLYPAAAARPRVGTVTVWSGGAIFGRRLDPAGNPQGPAFPVSTTSLEDLSTPQVALDAAGGFVVVWYKTDRDNNFSGVFTQSFDASGTRQGTETRLDTGPAPAGSAAVAVVNANGDFAAVWMAGRQRELDGPDGSGFAILGRIFRLPPRGADACVVGDGHLACDTLRDGGGSELDLELAAQPGDLPLAGNLDGDVRDDLCLYRDGLFLCDTAHDGGTPEVTIAFGGAGDVPLLGDVNGDGKDDACLRRRRRFLCDTAHNGATAEVQILFGRPADIPPLGDVDGDGDDDPCLYRAGRFFCDTAHDGRAAEVVVSFGSGGDVPLLGDVDKDGDDDFCVFTGDRFLCDTAHDGGGAEVEIPFAGPAGTVPILGNLDGF